VIFAGAARKNHTCWERHRGFSSYLASFATVEKINQIEGIFTVEWEGLVDCGGA
jgi:hypothetical protein